MGPTMQLYYATSPFSRTASIDAIEGGLIRFATDRSDP